MKRDLKYILFFRIKQQTSNTEIPFYGFGEVLNTHLRNNNIKRIDTSKRFYQVVSIKRLHYNHSLLQAKRKDMII